MFLTLLPTGCYRRVSYTSPHGRQVEIVNLGFNTRIGALSAQTDEGSLQIEDLDAQARSAAILAEIAGTLLQTAAPAGGAK